MGGSEYDLGMKNVIKRLSSGDDTAEQQQMLLALAQPIESRLSFPHTECASLAGFILFKAISGEMLVQWLVCREFFLPTDMLRACFAV